MIRSAAFCSLLLAVILGSAGCSEAQNIRTISAEGTAMAPTIKDGERIRIDRGFYRNSTVERFDIVIFLLSREQKEFVGKTGEVSYIKRIVGLPGETVEIRKGRTYVNGNELNESFIESAWEEDDFGPLTVPDGEYFVLGDNRANSFDSRYLKPATVKLSSLGGKVTDVTSARR